jgi:hypothetical protein
MRMDIAWGTVFVRPDFRGLPHETFEEAMRRGVKVVHLPSQKISAYHLLEKMLFGEIRTRDSEFSWGFQIV